MQSSCRTSRVVDKPRESLIKDDSPPGAEASGTSVSCYGLSPIKVVSVTIAASPLKDLKLPSGDGLYQVKNESGKPFFPPKKDFEAVLKEVATKLVLMENDPDLERKDASMPQDDSLKADGQKKIVIQGDLAANYLRLNPLGAKYKISIVVGNKVISFIKDENEESSQALSSGKQTIEFKVPSDKGSELAYQPISSVSIEKISLDLRVKNQIPLAYKNCIYCFDGENDDKFLLVRDYTEEDGSCDPRLLPASHDTPGYRCDQFIHETVAVNRLEISEVSVSINGFTAYESGPINHKIAALKSLSGDAVVGNISGLKWVDSKKVNQKFVSRTCEGHNAWK